MSKCIYKFVNAECGAGKTHALITMINKSKEEKYLIVQAKLDLLNQTFGQISVKSELITSENHTGNVDSEINSFLLKPHTRVLGITAKSFFKIDPDLLKGWKIFLDDVVNFHSFKAINEGNAKVKAILQEDIFSDLDHLNDKYSSTGKKKVEGDILALIENQFEMIDLNDHFVINNEYFKKVKVNEDGVRTLHFDEDVKQLTMLAWIDIAKYHNLDITFMANKFEESLLYKSEPNRFEQATFDGLRERTVPVSARLKVKYFSKRRVLSKTFRTVYSEEFNKVVQYINDELQGCEYYYTRNNSESFVMDGQYVPVDTRGMNGLQGYSTAVWLASCRPSPVEAKMTEDFFGISGDDLVRSREYQALEQFVQRGCLRDFSSTGVMTVYVFDEKQAMSLGGELEYIDVGIDDIESRAIGRPLSTIPEDLRNAFSTWKCRAKKNKVTAGNAKVLQVKYKKWKKSKAKEYPDIDMSSLDEQIFDMLESLS